MFVMLNFSELVIYLTVQKMLSLLRIDTKYTAQKNGSWINFYGENKLYLQLTEEIVLQASVHI